MASFAEVLKISIIQSHVVFVEERNHPWVSMSMVNSPMLLFCSGYNLYRCYNFAVSCGVLSLVTCEICRLVFIVLFFDFRVILSVRLENLSLLGGL